MNNRTAIEENPPLFRCLAKKVRHATLRALMANLHGIPEDNVVRYAGADGVDADGNPCSMSYVELEPHYLALGLYGYANQHACEVHYWQSDTFADRDFAIRFFAHELAHICLEDPKFSDDPDLADEQRADLFSDMALTAVQWADDSLSECAECIRCGRLFTEAECESADGNWDTEWCGCDPVIVPPTAPPVTAVTGPWTAVDLDGTLARYDGWVNADHIGEPIPAMADRVRQWLAEGKDVRIFTARAAATGHWVENSQNFDDAAFANQSVVAIQDWTEKHFGVRLPVTATKDYGMVALYDDRAIQVETNTGRLLLEKTDG